MSRKKMKHPSGLYVEPFGVVGRVGGGRGTSKKGTCSLPIPTSLEDDLSTAESNLSTVVIVGPKP
jgi:hypothetical protein